MFIEIGLIVLSVFCPLLVLIAYRQGVKDGKNIQENKELSPIINIPVKQTDFTKEQQREQTILENILNYDGTPQGQKEVI